MDSSCSGYIGDFFEGISSRFTDVTTVHSGKFNVVWKAKRYGRWWILKGLSSDYRNDEASRYALRKEYEILAGLHYPGVVAPVGIEEPEGFGPVIIMEMVEGMPLSRWLTAKPSRKRRRAVVLRILEALDYVHSKGVVHRDLKPSNIMVGPDDSVKLIDFGLADSQSHAILKQPAGTPRYMAPEQAELAQPDVRNDIYSLGIILADMRPGGYASIGRKCRRKANRRYRNVKEIKRAIGRRRILAIGSGVSAAALILALIFFTFYREITHIKEKSEIQKNENLALVSAVSHEKTKSAAMKNDLDSLSGVIITLDSRKSLVDSLVREGNTVLDEVYLNSPFRIKLDKINAPEDLALLRYLDKTSMELDDAVRQYMDGISEELDETERTEVRHRLMDHADEMTYPMDEKINRLVKSFYEGSH